MSPFLVNFIIAYILTMRTAHWIFQFWRRNGSWYCSFLTNDNFPVAEKFYFEIIYRRCCHKFSFLKFNNLLIHHLKAKIKLLQGSQTFVGRHHNQIHKFQEAVRKREFQHQFHL